MACARDGVTRVELTFLPLPDGTNPQEAVVEEPLVADPAAELAVVEGAALSEDEGEAEVFAESAELVAAPSEDEPVLRESVR